MLNVYLNTRLFQGEQSHKDIILLSSLWYTAVVDIMTNVILHTCMTKNYSIHLYIMIQGEVNNGLTCNTILYAQSVKGLCIKYTLHACKTCLPCLHFLYLGHTCHNPQEMSKNKL
jgi:hypothetical protein